MADVALLPEAPHPTDATEQIAAPKPGASRMAQLDVLRAVAILLVIGHHGLWVNANSGLFSPFSKWLDNFGWTGVDLFFVLSGFLIGGLLFRELRTRGSLNARRFLIRRGLKIWPAYYVYLLFSLACMVVIRHEGLKQAFLLLVPNFVHLQNYSSLLLAPEAADLLKFTTHTWTLAVEEHFYLVLTLFIWLVTRRRNNPSSGMPILPWVAAAVIVACLVGRLVLVYGGSIDNVYYVYRPTHWRADSLFFGVLLAYFYHFLPKQLAAVAQQRKLLIAAGLLLLVPSSVLGLHSPPIHTLGFTLLYLGYACLLIVVVYTPINSGRLGRFLGGRSGRFLAGIGYYSYSIYLWHFCLVWPLKLVLQKMLPHLSSLPQEVTWLLCMLIFACAGVAVGIAAARIVEMPFLRLRDRLFPSRSTALPVIVDGISAG